MLEAKHWYWHWEMTALVAVYVGKLWFNVTEDEELLVTFTAELYDNLSDIQKEILLLMFPEIKEAVDRWEETEPQEDENLPKIITSEE